MLVEFCEQKSRHDVGNISRICARMAGSALFSYGTCLVRHTRGPREHRRLTRRTLRLPETAICPSCSVSRSPITLRLSPRSVKWSTRPQVLVQVWSRNVRSHDGPGHVLLSASWLSSSNYTSHCLEHLPTCHSTSCSSE